MRKKDVLKLVAICVLCVCYACASPKSQSENSWSNFLRSVPDTNLSEIDSTYLENLELSESSFRAISADTIKLFFEKFEYPYTESYDYQLVNDFLRIDSLKKANVYEDYLQTLDLGMLRSAEVLSLGKRSLSDQNIALFWAIRYSSYEACPFYHGVDVYLTILDENELTKTIKVGSNYSVVDPPMAVYLPVYSKVAIEHIESSIESVELELGENNEKVVAESKETFVFDLKSLSYK